MIPKNKQKVNKNEMYYNKGDVVKYGSDEINTSGFITSNATKIVFNFALDKNLDNISNIEVSSLILNIRISTGGYVLKPSANFAEYISEIKKVGKHTIKITLKKEDGWGQTNNTPVSVSSQNYVVINLS